MAVHNQAMNTQSTPPTPAALLSEADARMAALDNFLQRSHAPLQGSILRAIAAQMTPAGTSAPTDGAHAHAPPPNRQPGRLTRKALLRLKENLPTSPG